MPRITNDKKDSTIKLRINEDTRLRIEKKCKKSGISISEYIRNLIEKDLMEKKQ